MSPGSETLPTLEPKNTTMLNVKSECFQPKQTIPYVESFEDEREEFVGHTQGRSSVLLSTTLGKKTPRTTLSLLKDAGMEHHKWLASNPLLLPDSMCQDLSYSSSSETCGNRIHIPLLSRFHPKPQTVTISVIKKSVISTIARIFNPLGLIGPAITMAKILLQSL
ncbi:hypothetical protein TNIN_165031 [Trichonephila inaurata madagascariensis]|uniref:Uncharacterized protein n=1 Tax=Trichonephila inaurata madagascariensis TaxID=2747483 RepID=A0A8X6M8L9_9ARAC|nr:hypothetical protein TNIN_165031 [Trichonephila inaurata madagascariensis]